MHYKKTYCLFGYFGFKNFGDDLMLINALHYLDRLKLNCKYIIFVGEDYYSKQKAFTSFKYIKVKYVRLNKFVNHIHLFYYALICDQAIWVGGTSLYETSSSYLDGLVWLQKTINKFYVFGKVFSFCNIGIGDFYSERGKNLYLKIINKSDRFSCRDQVSLMKLKKGFPEKSNIYEGGDLASLLEKPSFTRNPKYIIFCGHFQFAEDKDLIDAYVEILNDLSQGKDKILFIPMHQGTHSDNTFHKKVSEKLDAPFEIVKYSDNLFKYMSEANIVISMRLHGLFLADILGIPNIGIAYHDKVSIYVKNTNILVEDRNKKMGENICLENVQKVIAEYKKPVEFLNMERKKAINGMKVFEF